MKIKLGNSDSYSFAQIQERNSGQGKFVTFQWNIPLPMFLPIKRLSNVYFIENEKQLTKYEKKYNLINYLIGWWGLPFGPIYLFKSVRLNNKGGIDVTDDVYLNLNQPDYENGFVSILKKSTIFIHPKKDEIKEFEKVFQQLISGKVITEAPIIGLFIDTKKNEAPYYLIGLREDITEELKSTLTKAIYKRFYKQLVFELVRTQTMDENKEKFIKQGLRINCG
jgi:hypothetical protein